MLCAAVTRSEMITFVALLVTAAPDLRAARACMAAVESQKDACVGVVDAYVAVPARIDALRRCSVAFRRGLEQCLVANGVVVSEARRQLWQDMDASSEALSTCSARVEREAEWCVARASGALAMRDCRDTAVRALDECNATHARREAQLRERLRALDAEEQKAKDRAGAARTQP